MVPISLQGEGRENAGWGGRQEEYRGFSHIWKYSRDLEVEQKMQGCMCSSATKQLQIRAKKMLNSCIQTKHPEFKSLRIHV